jgi:MFS family permease
MALLGSIGLLNSMGTFSAYLEVNQLKNHSPGEIGWIFGVYSFLFLFCGLQVGPISDARGPRALLLTGSTLIVISLVTIGFCSQYWHFMLSFGITGGIGVALIFTPAVSAIGHYFHLKRGTATGLALGGGSVGGVIFPLVLQHLFEKIGFAWATRVLALICLVCLTCGCLLVSSRLPKKSASRENLLPDLTIFLDAKLALTALCSFFLDWALFIPITYISSYALSHGINQRLSYQLLAILNAASFFGRWLPGYAADKFGRFNTLIVTVTLCLVCNLGLWLPAGNSAIMIITYSACFGFASGSNISLLPVCVGQLCDTKHYGRYYSTCFLFSSFRFVH